MEQLGCGPVVGLRRLERGDVREDAARGAGDDARVTEGLEVHSLGALDLHVATEPAPGADRVEADRGDADALADLNSLSIERQQAHRVRRHVDEAREVALAVAQHLPERVARHLEVLARATPEIDEGVVEAAEVEERVEPRPLDPGGLAQLCEARGHLLCRRRERRPLGQRAGVARGDALEHQRVGHLLPRVLGVEVDGRLEAVAEAVDVGRVRVDVLTERVRVLDEEAQRLGVVGRLQRAGRDEGGRHLFAARTARRVLHPGADHHGL